MGRLALMMFLLVCLGTAGGVHAGAAPSPVISASIPPLPWPEPTLDVTSLDTQAQSLTAYFAILEDPQRTLQLADVQTSARAAQFTSGQAPAWSLNFGVTPSAYWLRLRLKNSASKPFEGMLEFTYPRLAASVQLFTPGPDQRYSELATGYLRPFSGRPYPHHFYVLPLALEAGAEATVYLRFHSLVNLEIPARLWQREAFHRYERNDYSAQALYFGMVLAMLVFNFLLFVALRASRYLLYVAFSLSSALSVAATNGLAIEYLWGDSPAWINMAANTGYSVSLALGLMFMRSMIATRQLVPRLDRVLRATIVVHLLFPIGLALAYTQYVRPQLVAGGLTALLALATGVICAFKRDRSAMFFAAAFAVMCVGAAANSLRALGLVETTFFTTNGIQIGSAAEMLLLAFALADRYNIIRREKEQAQREALAAQAQLVETLQSSERLLESRVSARAQELEVANARLAALSATDGLTGLANRRRFDEVLYSEWRRAARTGQLLAVGVLDVDWFKKYNDHYGHLAGDACLRRIATLMAASICRTGDLVARFGGEEFAFVAIVSDGAAALAMADKLRGALEAAAMPHALSAFGHVTACIGVAAVRPNEQDAPSGLVQAADEALYRAKAQGRNRCVLSEPGALTAALGASTDAPHPGAR